MQKLRVCNIPIQGRSKYAIAGLCYAHNDATNPRAYRSDHEHYRQSQRARAIRNRLERLGAREGRDYKEWESGNYWPM